MFLIVDTNVLFSFFHSESNVKEYFESLREKGVSLLVPQYMFDELLGIKPHLKDAPLFALSLAFNNAPIWSREPRLKMQKVVEVLHDKEVEKYFGLTEA